MKTVDFDGMGLNIMGYGKTPVMGGFGQFFASTESQEEDFKLSGGLEQGTMLRAYSE